LTSSEGGTKFDTGKARWDLVDYDTLEGMVDILTFGATKYEDRNWEKGILYGRVWAAYMRHNTAWWQAYLRGEDGTDPETGRSHLDHAQCCLHFLATYEKRGLLTFDDRPGSPHVKE
jgi:hypothetical protein